MSKKIMLVTILLMFFSVKIQAQDKPRKINYEKEPAWITMMDDPKANYYETIKAFKKYYRERPLPEEPKELAEGDSFEKEIGLEEENGKKKSKRELKREARRANPNEPNYAGEVRAFRAWFYSIKPWVREDGSIVSQAEQQAIIEKQQAELKEIEKANSKN